MPGKPGMYLPDIPSHVVQHGNGNYSHVPPAPLCLVLLNQSAACPIWFDDVHHIQMFRIATEG